MTRPIQASLLLVLTLSLLLPASVAAAADLVVTSTADAGAGSLRDAISASAAGDRIVFDLPPNSVVELTSGTLVLPHSLTIDGPGADQLTIRRAEGAGYFRILESQAGSALVLRNLSIEGGAVAGDSFVLGLGLWAKGDATVEGVRFGHLGRDDMDFNAVGCAVHGGNELVIRDTLFHDTVRCNSVIKVGVQTLIERITVVRSGMSDGACCSGNAVEQSWTPANVVIRNSTFVGKGTQSTNRAFSVWGHESTPSHWEFTHNTVTGYNTLLAWQGDPSGFTSVTLTGNLLDTADSGLVPHASSSGYNLYRFNPLFTMGQPGDLAVSDFGFLDLVEFGPTSAFLPVTAASPAFRRTSCGSGDGAVTDDALGQHRPAAGCTAGAFESSATPSFVEVDTLGDDSVDCSEGGVEIIGGYDVNLSGTLEESERNQSNSICYGLKGIPLQVDVEDLSAGDLCVGGGIRVEVGLDENGDGTLTLDEESADFVICQGTAAGASLVQVTATDPATCLAGGSLIENGVDIDGNGTLDPGEVTVSQVVCEPLGRNWITRTVAIEPGPTCAAGGNRLERGVDANRNGVLDDTEVRESLEACHGEAGEDGLTTLVATVPLAAGEGGCPAGGSVVFWGLDKNRDGELQQEEVDDDMTLCNGEPGADMLVDTERYDSHDSCPAGALVIRAGGDSNYDGSLDEDEVERTSWICDGLDGEDALGTLVESTVLAPGDVCAAGGVEVRIGLDVNGDGILSDDGVRTTHAICHGTHGRHALVSVQREADTAVCPTGGLRVSSGVDLNGNGELDEAEITSTESLCDRGLLVATEEVPPGDACENGGRRVLTGLDDNHDGVFDPTEVREEILVCDGTNGRDGADGEDGADGQDGAKGVDGRDGVAAAIRIDPLPAGDERCPGGGILVNSGLDTNADGALGDDEIAASHPVCQPVVEAAQGGGCTSTGGTPTSFAASVAFLMLGLLRARRRR